MGYNFEYYNPMYRNAICNTSNLTMYFLGGELMKLLLILVLIVFGIQEFKLFRDAAKIEEMREQLDKVRMNQLYLKRQGEFALTLLPHSTSPNDWWLWKRMNDDNHFKTGSVKWEE